MSTSGGLCMGMVLLVYLLYEAHCFIDQCAQTQCGGNGVCEERHCLCHAGFSGSHCERCANSEDEWPQCRGKDDFPAIYEELIPHHDKCTSDQPTTNTSLVVVRPFTVQQLPSLLRDIRTWASDGHRPCIGPTTIKADLLLLTDVPLRNTQLLDIMRALEPVRLCFQSVIAESVNLTSHENVYTSMHATGPNSLFLHMFLRPNAEKYSHMFWMEPDAHAIRDSWLPQLGEEIIQTPDLWVKGSVFVGYSFGAWKPLTHRLHVNGNSLYTLRNSCFRELVRNLLRMHPDLPWDLSLDRAFRGSAAVYSSHYIRSKFVRNYGSVLYPLRYIQANEASTYFIHGTRSVEQRTMRTQAVVTTTPSSGSQCRPCTINDPGCTYPGVANQEWCDANCVGGHFFGVCEQSFCWCPGEMAVPTCRPCVATDPGCDHPGNADQLWCNQNCKDGTYFGACDETHCFCPGIPPLVSSNCTTNSTNVTNPTHQSVGTPMIFVTATIDCHRFPAGSYSLLLKFVGVSDILSASMQGEPLSPDDFSSWGDENALFVEIRYTQLACKLVEVTFSFGVLTSPSTCSVMGSFELSGNCDSLCEGTLIDGVDPWSLGVFVAEGIGSKTLPRSGGFAGSCAAGGDIWYKNMRVNYKAKKTVNGIGQYGGASFWLDQGSIETAGLSCQLDVFLTDATVQGSVSAGGDVTATGSTISGAVTAAGQISLKTTTSAGNFMHSYTPPLNLARLANYFRCFSSWLAGLDDTTTTITTVSFRETNGGPVDCVLSAWGPWSGCSASCGSGHRQRTRSVQVEPENGGTACNITVETETCNTNACPNSTAGRCVPCTATDPGCTHPGNADQEWCDANCLGGAYYGACDETHCLCPGGRPAQQRCRPCVATDPGCDHPGNADQAWCDENCLGATYVGACDQTHCFCPGRKVDCQVGMWSAWTGCPVSCGGGLMQRTRAVLVQPALGGKACPPTLDTQQCNTNPCPGFKCRPCKASDPGCTRPNAVTQTFCDTFCIGDTYFGQCDKSRCWCPPAMSGEITITCGAGRNVITLTAAQLRITKQVIIGGNAGAELIINIPDTNVIVGPLHWVFSSVRPANLVINFPHAETLSITTDNAWMGTIVAPRAITQFTGELNGQLIVGNLLGGNGTVLDDIQNLVRASCPMKATLRQSKMSVQSLGEGSYEQGSDQYTTRRCTCELSLPPWSLSLFTQGNIGSPAHPRGSEIQGSVACGGDAFFSGGSVNTRSTNTVFGVGMHVGGNLVLSSGASIAKGGIMVRGDVEMDRGSVAGAVLMGGHLQGTGHIGGRVQMGGSNHWSGDFAAGMPQLGVRYNSFVNLDDLAAYYSCVSASLYVAPETPGTEWSVVANGVLELRCGSGSNVVQIPAAHFRDIVKISIVGPSDAAVIINVLDLEATLGNWTWSYHGVLQGHVLMNFPHANRLHISAGPHMATILAPGAEVFFPWGVISGTLICKHLHGGNGIIRDDVKNQIPLQCTLPACSCPSTAVSCRPCIKGVDEGCTSRSPDIGKCATCVGKYGPECSPTECSCPKESSVAVAGPSMCRPCKVTDTGCHYPGLASQDWCAAVCHSGQYNGDCQPTHCFCEGALPLVPSCTGKRESQEFCNLHCAKGMYYAGNCTAEACTCAGDAPMCTSCTQPGCVGLGDHWCGIMCPAGKYYGGQCTPSVCHCDAGYTGVQLTAVFYTPPQSVVPEFVGFLGRIVDVPSVQIVRMIGPPEPQKLMFGEATWKVTVCIPCYAAQCAEVHAALQQNFHQQHHGLPLQLTHIENQLDAWRPLQQCLALAGPSNGSMGLSAFTAFVVKRDIRSGNGFVIEVQTELGFESCNVAVIAGVTTICVTLAFLVLAAAVTALARPRQHAGIPLSYRTDKSLWTPADTVEAGEHRVCAS